jgi:thioredoxin-like negative regulator of GroEL
VNESKNDKVGDRQRDMAKKFEDQIVFAKVDVQASGDLAEQFDVTSIPTLILFKKGKEWDRLTGHDQHPEGELP